MFSTPLYIKIKSSNFIPLVQVVVSGHKNTTYKKLREYGEDIQDRLEDFVEVDRVFLFDNRERQIHVRVNPTLAQQIGLTPLDIQQRIIVRILIFPQAR